MAQVTVLVPVRNEELSIGACLESILGQDGPPFEVLVIDGRSVDGTRDVVGQVAAVDPRVRLLDNPAGSISCALNIGLESAEGEIIARVDGHSTIEGGYIELASDLLSSDPSLGAVGGIKLAEGSGPVGTAIAAAFGSRFSVGNSTYHFADKPHLAEHVPFGVYRVDAVKSVGGWDPEFPVNQDFELDYRLRRGGWRILLDPRLRIHWRCRTSLRSLWQQYRRYGRGKAAVMLRHPCSARVRHLAPTAFFAALVGLSARKRTRPLSIGAAAAYCATAVGAAKAASAAHPARPSVGLVASASVVMHGAYSVGVAEGLVTAGRVRTTDRREMRAGG